MERSTNENKSNPYWRLTNAKGDLIETGKLHQRPKVGKSCIVGFHYTKDVIEITKESPNNQHIEFKTNDGNYTLVKN